MQALFKVLLLCSVSTLFCAPGCDALNEGDGDGDADVGDQYLEGTLGGRYDLSFHSTQAQQFVTGDHLVVEFVRGEGINEESPIMISLRPTPNGPATLRADRGRVMFTNSVAGGEGLPELSEATVVLEAFTPERLGSAVAGSFDATFVDGSSGASLTLTGRFETTLDIID